MEKNKAVSSRTRLGKSTMVEEEYSKVKRNRKKLQPTTMQGNARTNVVIIDSSDDDDDDDVRDEYVEYLGGFSDFGESKGKQVHGGNVGSRAKTEDGLGVDDVSEREFEKWRKVNYGNGGSRKDNESEDDDKVAIDVKTDDRLGVDDVREREFEKWRKVNYGNGGSGKDNECEDDDKVAIDVEDGPMDVESGGSDGGDDSTDNGDTVYEEDGDEMSSSEEDCDYEDDPDFEEDEEERRVVEFQEMEREREREKVGAKRKRDTGNVISLDDDVAVVDPEDASMQSIGSNRDSSVHSSQGPVGVGRRTRSHSNFAVGKKEKRVSYLDEDDHESECSKEKRVSYLDEDDHESECSGQKHPIVDPKGSGESIKHRKKGRPKAPDFVDIMMRNILETGEEFLEEQKAGCDAASEGKLPQKFTFGIDKPTPVEKSESEKEEDNLWNEMALALASSEIENNAEMVQDDDCNDLVDESDGLKCCQQGHHEYILDDEIGLRCKFCYFIKTEIKDMMPDFCPNPWGNPRRNERRENDRSFSNNLEDQDIGCSSHAGHNLLPGEGTVWDIIPGVRETMYPHQREGFEFIWMKTAGDIYLEKLKENKGGGGGCIISHAPGTGKTRLTIVFLQTYLKLYPMSRPVIIAPCTMLMTWEEEFRKWKIDIPFHNLNHSELSIKENHMAQNLMERNNVRGVKGVRMLKLYSWKKGNSILGLSYSLFEKLTSGGSSKKNKKKNEVQYTVEVTQYRRILFELPGILVFDEGHTPRNDKSNIWKAVSEIRTEKRIILSGTPFQNNFRELYNTLCLARPSFADRNKFASHGAFRERGCRKTSQALGKYTSLTSLIGKDGESLDNRLKELRRMISPFVHVHKGTILQESLPGLDHSVVVLHPTEMQRDLFDSIKGSDHLTTENAASLVSVHSSLYLRTKFHKSKKLKVDTELLEKLRLNPDAGVKTKFLIELIRLSKALNERVLVFSQFLGPLALIRDQLTSYFDWVEGKEVLYMYGNQDLKLRQSFINAFNDEGSEARVLLASTKACREGISLVGASRVVLLDVVWNPSVEWQAISRAYRLGQKKFVYAYSLIAFATKEADKYLRQTQKDRLSKLVFKSSDGDKDKHELPEKVCKDQILEEISQHHKLKSMFQAIVQRSKESNLLKILAP